MKGNTTAFHILFWSNLLQRLATKPVTIAVDTVVVVIVNGGNHAPYPWMMVPRMSAMTATMAPQTGPSHMPARTRQAEF